MESIRRDWSAWRDRNRWPYAAPRFVFLAEAGDRIGRAAYGEHWLSPFGHYSFSAPIPDPDGAMAVAQELGEDGQAVLPEIVKVLPRYIWSIDHDPAYSPSFERWRWVHKLYQLDLEHGDVIREQRERAAELLCDMFADGLLVGLVYRTDKLDWMQLPAIWWQNPDRENARDMLRTCRIDGIAGRAADPEPYWIFVAQANLDAAIAGIEQSRQQPKDKHFAMQLPPEEGDQPRSIVGERARRGRPKKKDLSLAIFRERLESKLTKQDRSQEAQKIVDSWKGESPPLKKSVSGWLAKVYGVSIWEAGKLMNPDDVLAALPCDKIGKSTYD